MTLLQNLYTVISSDSSAESVNAIIQLNKNHQIFQGHFPGQPVVPGVCMVLMVKELSEEKLGRKCRLTESDNIKFLSVMDPNVNSVVNVSIVISPVNGGYGINASLYADNITFFKIKATLQPQ